MSDTASCEWAIEHIEPYLDGEIEDGARAALESHCTTCAACARELSLAIRIRRDLRARPVYAAPAHVIEQAAHEITPTASNVIPLRTRRLRRRLALPLAAAAVAVVAAALWFGNARLNSQDYSDEEIRRAHAELAMAFGYVDRYSDGVLREEVFEKRVVPTIERAVRGNEDVTSPPPGRS
jgi:anti-sigma factor (TIGR02949 family)